MSSDAHQPTPPGIRASDREREQVVAVLRDAVGEGMLTLGEADERITAAYAARYRHELVPLLADLPEETRGPFHTAGMPPEQPRRAGTRWYPVVMVVIAALFVVWALTPERVLLWPVLPLLFVGLRLAGPARWRRRPDGR